MERKFEKICKYKDVEVKLPQRSTKNSAGYDFFCLAHQTLPPFKATLVKTGVKAKFPEDEVLLLFNRSSNPTKKNLILLNGVGVVDSDYFSNQDNDGEIGFMFYNMSHDYIFLEKGDKLGQGVFVKFNVTDDDAADGQRSGGFGSTDKTEVKELTDIDTKKIENQIKETKKESIFVDDLKPNEWHSVEDITRQFELKDKYKQQAEAWLASSSNDDGFVASVTFKIGDEYFDIDEPRKDKSKDSKNTKGMLTACKLAIKEAKMYKIKKLIIHTKHEGTVKWAAGLWKANLVYTKEYVKYINNLKDIELVFDLISKDTKDENILRAYNNAKDVLTNKKESTFIDIPAKKIVKGEAYCDGSYNAKTKVYGYGVLLKINGKTEEFKGKGKITEKATMRNVAGEIDGAKRAVNEAINRGVTDLTLYYDYDGIEKWATLKWARNKKWTIEYSKFMQTQMKKINIRFVHVTGHSGNKGNERVDKLAKKAVGLK